MTKPALVRLRRRVQRSQRNRRPRRPLPGAWLVAAWLVVVAAPLVQGEQPSVRVATFNVSLYGSSAGETLERLRGGSDPQARTLAEIIQRARPDLLLLNEIDYAPDDALLKVFVTEYLAVPQHVAGAPEPALPIDFPHRFTAPVNTGVHSGIDLNRDGQLTPTAGQRTYGNDCWGYGTYPGQYGMAVLSRYPIARDEVRTFQQFRWKDMPEARLPDDPATPEPADWYPAEALAHFRLSSKSHWDIPVLVAGRRLHVLASHPTPPVFDGQEDRNGRRNHDEIRFWRDYIGPAERASYLYDDEGKRGGLRDGRRFVILGDLNADPADGESRKAIADLLEAPQIAASPTPASDGGREQSQLQQGANLQHQGEPQFDTLDARDAGGPGNLRVDYVLPSANLPILASGVFWPTTDDPLSALTGVFPFPSSDHRLVWVDVVIDDLDE